MDIFRIFDSHIQASCRQVTQEPELNWYFVTIIMLHLKTFGLKSESILFKLKTKKGAIIHQSGTIGIWYCDQMGIYLETPVCSFWSPIFVQGFYFPNFGQKLRGLYYFQKLSLL